MASTTFLQQAYLAYFGRPADVSGLSFYNDKSEAQVIAAFSASPESQAFFGSLNTLAQINTIYQNLFNRPAEPAGLTYWSGEINAGRLSLAQASMGILNGAQNADKIAVSNKLAASTAFTAALDTTDEMIGYQGTAVITSARAFLASVSSDAATLTAATSTTALNATVAATVAAGSTASVAGQTFTLTTGFNNFAGGSSNDSFDASLSSTGAQTWQASDVLSGSTGVDTINATLIASVTPVNMTGIDVVNVTVNTASTLNLVNATGLTNVNSVNGAGVTTLSGIATSVAASIADTTQSHTINYSNVTGSADAATIKVSGIATGTNTFTVAGIETLTLNAVTSASVIDTLTVANTTSLLASGDQALTITAGVSATVRNVDASAKTAGGLTMTMGAVADATIVGGAGNDVFTIDAVGGTVTANGGAGNDTFTAATNLLITDTINGGDGIDTLSSVFASVSTAGYLTPTTRTISNIETLLVTDAVTGALTAVGVDTGINNVTMGFAGTNTAAAVTFNAGTSTLNIGTATSTAATITTSVAVAGSTGGTDNITIKNNNVSTVNSFVAAATIAATNTETLTLDTGTYTTAVGQVTGTVSVTGSTGFQTAETLILKGGNVLTMGAVTADIIDASGMTGVVGTTLTTVTGTTATTVTGSGGNDVLFIDGTNVSVNGGAGNDTITGGSSNDILLGGTGQDTITSAAGNDSVDGGAGNDTVVMGTTFTVADTLIGGADVDTLSIGQAATATIAARASGFETLLLSAGATQDMALFTNNTGFTRVNANTAGGTFSFTNAGAGVVTLGAETATAAITFALATGTGSSDALTLSSVDNAVQTAVTANDIETLTLANAATAASTNAVTITTLAATALKTLNITGLGGTIITNAITNATALTAVNDNHTGAGVVTLDLSTATGAVTYTGGSATGATTLVMGNGNNVVTANSATTVGNFTVTGGTGNDSITGGFGADSFIGGAGADTLIGGSGADTLAGGAGNDSISGGDGIDQFSTDSGADTMDGGAGTDVLTITAGFSDITLDTITLIETLEMGAVGSTMTIAQHAAFTSITNPGAVTLSDVGAVAAKAGVVAYNLAAGTNTFTASATAADNSVVGGTGADTFNFGLTTASAQLLDVNDTIKGGTGTDTLNLTGNVALTVTLTNVSEVENIVLANTTTAVALTLATGNATSTQSLTIDGQALTSALGTLTVDGALETDGSLIIVGGTLSDTLTGGGIADTITGGTGADSITGGDGVDNLAGNDGNDVFVIGTAAHLDAGEVMTGGNGTDTLLLTVTAVDLTGFAAANDNLVTEGSIEKLVVLATTSAYTLDEAISGTALAISQTTNSTNVQTFTTTMVGTTADYSLFTTAATTYGPAATATLALDATDIFVFTGSAAADTIKAVPGVINQITSGLSADAVTLASGKDVVITSVGAAHTTVAADTVTAFTTGTGNDRIDLDISDLLATLGGVANATAADGTTTITGALVVETVAKGTATTLNAATEIVVITGTNADAAALITQIGTLGTVLTLTADPTNNHGLLVVWNDGTNTHVSVVKDADSGGNGVLLAADLTVFDIVVLAGVLTGYHTDNFAAVS
jgi:Ca2+-binding RTX toxin-like protein